MNVKPQNKRLTKARINAIHKLLAERYLIRNNDELIEFLSLYVDCEATAIKLVDYHKRDVKPSNSPKKYSKLGSEVKKDPNSKNDFAELNYEEVQKAVKYFALEINDIGIIARIFKSSTGIRGKKTPRQLRNGIMHAKSVEDINEVVERSAELRGLMEKWMGIIEAIKYDS